jgi:hypothetical protein
MSNNNYTTTQDILHFGSKYAELKPFLDTAMSRNKWGRTHTVYELMKLAISQNDSRFVDSDIAPI